MRKWVRLIPSKADEATLRGYVRFTPESGQTADGSVCPLSAKSGLTHRSKKRLRAKLSRDSVQSHARIKAELALCLLRGEVSARLSDVVDTATRPLDRQHRRPGCRIDVQRGRLCRVGSGSGAVEMPIAEDHSIDWR